MEFDLFPKSIFDSWRIICTHRWINSDLFCQKFTNTCLFDVCMKKRKYIHIIEYLKVTIQKNEIKDRHLMFTYQTIRKACQHIFNTLNYVWQTAAIFNCVHEVIVTFFTVVGFLLVDFSILHLKKFLDY